MKEMHVSNKIDELITQLCPDLPAGRQDGVEYVALGDIVKSTKKGTLKQNQLIENGIYPVVNSGRDYYGFYDSFNNDGETITVASRGEYAGFIRYEANRFWAGGLCYPYQVKSKDVVNPKYLFYWLKRDENNIMQTLVARGSIPALNKQDLEKVTIPLPPLPVQREIVRILDRFTELTAELTAELAGRKKQYEYYRDTLLSFDLPYLKKDLSEEEGGAREACAAGIGADTRLGRLLKDLCPDLPAGRQDGVEWKTIDETCNITAGGDIPKERFSEEETDKYSIPVVTNGIGQNAFHGFTDIPKVTEPAVTVAARGTIGYAEYREYPYYPVIRLLSVIPRCSTALNTRYLYYILQGRKYNVPMSGIPQLTVPMLKKEVIPLPPLPVQREIVRILDRFDALCNDLSVGLPAEIEARKKQYEYYRDKLLSF